MNACGGLPHGQGGGAHRESLGVVLATLSTRPIRRKSCTNTLREDTRVLLVTARSKYECLRRLAARPGGRGASRKFGSGTCHSLNAPDSQEILHEHAERGHESTTSHGSEQV